MHILLDLFLTFFRIGLFTIGGGYAMIPMIKSEVVAKGWISEELLVDFIAISESTPGPFAINVATFIGNSQYGVFGAISATLGVVMPSLLIILIIAKSVSYFLKNKYVKYALDGVKPVVIGLILSVAIDLIIDYGFHASFDLSKFDLKAIAIMLVSFTILKLKKNISPIYVIILSAVMGIALYGYL